MSTIGSSVGKFLGNAAAYTVHGAVSAAQYTGQFGKDVASGATEQYAVKSAELETKRLAAARARGMVSIPAPAPALAKQRRVNTAK